MITFSWLRLLLIIVSSYGAGYILCAVKALVEEGVTH